MHGDDEPTVRTAATQSKAGVDVQLRSWPQCEALMTIEKPFGAAHRRRRSDASCWGTVAGELVGRCPVSEGEIHRLIALGNAPHLLQGLNPLCL